MLAKYVHGEKFNEYLLELKMILEEDSSNYTLKDIINEFVSKFVTPEKLKEIISNDTISEFDIQYDEESKKLLFNNTEVTGVTKSLIVLYIIVYYSLSQIEDLESVQSTFMKKSYSILKSLLIRKTLLQRLEVDIETLIALLEIIQKRNLVACLLLLVISILLLSNISMNIKRSIVLELSNIITMTGEKFAVSIYYLFDKIRTISSDNLYLNYLPEEIYNNLYASEIVEYPLPVLRDKIANKFEEKNNEEDKYKNWS